MDVDESSVRYVTRRMETNSRAGDVVRSFVPRIEVETSDHENVVDASTLKIIPSEDDSYTDISLEDFLSTLYACIRGDKIQNSFKDFNYEILKHKNKLYQAIESYRDNGTIFYSKFITDYPTMNIKRIGEILLGENVYCEGRGAYHDGTYFLKFTVYYEKN